MTHKKIGKAAIITPSTLSGTIEGIQSKSIVHRLLFAYFCGGMAVDIEEYKNISEDIDATISCLQALKEGKTHFYCNESGTTLRFLLPLAMSICSEATFHCNGRLSNRPLSPLRDIMEEQGCKFKISDNKITVKGKFLPANVELLGNISSQFFSGLIFTYAYHLNNCRIQILGKLESAPYLKMTTSCLADFGIKFKVSSNLKGEYLQLEENSKWVIPKILPSTEGDWSNGAFWLLANELGHSVGVTNLKISTLQGDSAFISFVEKIKNANKNVKLNLSDCPDLITPLSVLAAFTNITVTFEGCKRLRFKESDRIESTCSLINSLGGSATSTEDELEVEGKGYLHGGTVNSFGDHRIAMAAAIAATRCQEPVTIEGASAVMKSYPYFFDDFISLGGKVKYIGEKNENS